MKHAATPPVAAPASAAGPVLRMLLAAMPAAKETAEAADGDRAIASAGMTLLARMMLVRFAIGAVVLILAATLIILS